MSVTISSRKIVRGLAVCGGWLVLAHLVMQFLKFNYDHSNVVGLVRFFDLDQERNLPTVFSFGLLLTAAGVLGLIARDAAVNAKPYPARWSGLMILFFWVALDEILCIHEEWLPFLRGYFNTKGLLYYCWQIPYLLVLAVLMFFYFPFIKVLAPVRRWVIMAGVLYFTGVVVCESLSGLYHYLTGNRGESIVYMLLTTIEESCEMAGVIVFIYAMLEYARREVKHIDLIE